MPRGGAAVLGRFDQTMIVRQFLCWLRTASASERADATSALARAYLASRLTPDERTAAEGAMLLLLDDPSPLVRQAMAEVFAATLKAPPAVVLALAHDQPEVAAPLLEYSPLLVDADLVDLVATVRQDGQAAIARREPLPSSVAAALAEVGSSETCLFLLENEYADIAVFSLERIVARFGHLAAIREAMLARDDLPAQIRQTLVARLSELLADFVVSRDWLDAERAQRIAREACDKATVTLAAEAAHTDIRPLIRHLRESGQLTAGLILRALLSGNIALFEEALAELADVPRDRVAGLIHDSGRAGFRALYDRAGLPASTFTAFREAIDAMREGGWAGDPLGGAGLKRRVIERVLTRCEAEVLGDVGPLVTLLRRFATEAAREDARRFCDELMAEVAVMDAERLLVAA